MKIQIKIILAIVLLVVVTFGYFFMNENSACKLNSLGNNYTYPVQLSWGYGELKWKCGNIFPVYDKGWMSK